MQEDFLITVKMNKECPNWSANCDVPFVSWNVKSLNHPVKRKKVLTYLSKLKVGIAFLQETHLRTFDHFRLRGGWIGQSFHSNFHSKSRGVAILVNKSIPLVVSKIESDSSGRYVIVVGRLYNTPVILANVYAPHWDDSSFFFKFLCSYSQHGYTSPYSWRRHELCIVTNSRS